MPESESLSTHSPQRPDRRRSEPSPAGWPPRRGAASAAAAPPVGVGHPAQGTAVEFRGRITPDGRVGTDFTAHGILTGAGGRATVGPLRRDAKTIASALFTLTADGDLVSRVLDQSVHALDIAGTLSVYQRPHGGADFDQPASFTEGTEVGRFDLALQDVLAVFAPAQGLPTLSGDMRQTKAAGLARLPLRQALRRERAAAAHAGDRDRSTRRSGDAQRRARGRGQLVARVAAPMPGRATPVAVVGAGVKAPGGLTPDELWATVCAARSAAEPFVDAAAPGRGGGGRPGDRLRRRDVPASDPGPSFRPVSPPRVSRPPRTRSAPWPVRCRPRNAARWCAASGSAPTPTWRRSTRSCCTTGLRGVNPLTVPVVMPSSLAALLSLRSRPAGTVLTVSTACASGATAIGEGVELLRRGAADLVLAGGVDALLTFGVVCSFLRLDAMTRTVEDLAVASRPFDVDRDGFLLGEGAGFVVLQRLPDVVGPRGGPGHRRRLRRLCRGPPPRRPRAGRRGRAALHAAGARRCGARPGRRLACQCARHQHAGQVTSRRRPRCRDCSPEARRRSRRSKGATGHLIGGSGAVEAIVTLHALRSGSVPPVSGTRRVDPEIDLDVVLGQPRQIAAGYGLSNSFGFGGVNACLVLGPPP